MKKIIIGGCASLAGIGIAVGTYLFETAPSTHQRIKIMNLFPSLYLPLI